MDGQGFQNGNENSYENSNENINQNGNEFGNGYYDNGGGQTINIKKEQQPAASDLHSYRTPTPNPYLSDIEGGSNGAGNSYGGYSNYGNYSNSSNYSNTNSATEPYGNGDNGNGMNNAETSNGAGNIYGSYSNYGNYSNSSNYSNPNPASGLYGNGDASNGVGNTGTGISNGIGNMDTSNIAGTGYGGQPVNLKKEQQPNGNYRDASGRYIDPVYGGGVNNYSNGNYNQNPYGQGGSYYNPNDINSNNMYADDGLEHKPKTPGSATAGLVLGIISILCSTCCCCAGSA